MSHEAKLAAKELAFANAPIDTFVGGDEKVATGEVDAALQFLRAEGDIHVSTIDEKKLVRKIDFMVIPLCWGVYTFQFIDKTLVNYANVMGLTKDTHMNAAQFSYLATFFYVTFAVFQPLHGLLIQRFPVGKYLGINTVLWGIMIAVHSACSNFGGLIVVRLLLGVFEAASAPSLLIITGMWYKRNEQPLRIGIWYLGIGAGGCIGALASFGFQFYTAKTFKSWQIMYLVFGILTSVWGVLVFFLIPDNPMSSRLSSDEKVFAIERLRSNLTGIENRTFKKDQMMEALLDYKTWMIVVIILAANVPTGITGSFSSTLIKGFGYTSKESALLNIPSGVIGMISVLVASYVSGRNNSRCWGIVGLLLPGIIGGGLIGFLPSGNQYKGAKLAGIYLIGTFGANLAIMYSWAAANYAGHTKKLTINAVILIAYGASNIIGPLTFTGATAPEYIPAKVAIMATLALGVIATITLRFMYVWENKRRDKEGDQSGLEHLQDVEFMDLTDKQNMRFRYAL